MTERIGLTGATGRLGRLVAHDLAQEGVPLRLVVRDPSRAPALDNCEVAVAPFGHTPEAVAALTGIRTLLMVSADEKPDRLQEHLDFLDAAAEAGVGHVVYTSFMGAAPDAVFTLARDHWATEEHLRASGMAWTVLRDNLYADDLRYFVVDGVIRGPAGDGRVSAVARADIARVAGAVLRDPAAHAGSTYELTGPEALSMDEVATIYAEVTGREARFENETIEQAYRSRERWNPPPWQADAWVSTYAAIASGVMAPVTGAVRDITGRDPMTLREVISSPRARP